MQALIDTLNGIIWSNSLIYLCLGAGLFFSVMTRFVQVRLVSDMWRLLLQGQKSSAGVSPFQALTLSLSGRVGTGNIAGVAAAIGFGGPGAIFWMWLVAFLGAATSYIECTLGQIYKEKHDGQFRGGPAYYIEKATGQRWYAVIFACATVLACGFLLPGVQANSIGNAVVMALDSKASVNTSFGTVSTIKIITGTVLIIATGFIILGGVKRIARFTQLVVPFMALAYILVALVIVILNFDRVPGLIAMIFSDAFSPMAGFGAAVGWGVKRGIYSNEAGQGTGPHAAAAAEVEHPAQQGLVQAFSVYIDTLFICTATALMILITQSYNVHGAQGGFLLQYVSIDLAANSPDFTQHAIEKFFPGLGNYFVAIALMFFSFTTILAYYYIAETNIQYLKRHFRLPGAILLLKIGLMVMTFYGAIKTADLAWGLGDLGVGLMAWLNILGIIIIFFAAKPAIKALKDYERQRKNKVKHYHFDPESLAIKKAEFWVSKK